MAAALDWDVNRHGVVRVLPAAVEMSDSQPLSGEELTKISFMVYSVVYVENIFLHSEFQHVF